MSHWEILGDKATDYYERFKMEQKLCLKPGQNVKIKGLFNGNADVTKLVSIFLNDCSDLTSPMCKNDTTRQALIDAQLSQNMYYVMDFYLLNIAFNPENRDPLIYKIESQNWFTFSDTFSKEVLVEVATYEI